MTLPQLQSPQANEASGDGGLMPLAVLIGSVLVLLVLLLPGLNTAGEVVTDSAAAEAVDLDVQPVGVTFASPADGAEVFSPFEVVLNADGVALVPLAEANPEANEGHFHLLIDRDFIPTGQTFPATDGRHRALTDGSHTLTLRLNPGTYTLRAQVADAENVALDEAYRAEITVTVLAP